MKPLRNKKYCLTIIDRFSRFINVVPLVNIEAKTVADALIDNWFKLFGCPKEIITDRGSQFTSELFKQIMNIFGVKLNHSTSFHPQTNGLIERSHRYLKSSIKARSEENWIDQIPIVVLAWNNTIRYDLQNSPSQIVFGQMMLLPCDLFEDIDHNSLYTNDQIAEFIKEMNRIKSVSTCLHSQIYPEFRLKDLESTDYVFIKLDKQAKGPYKVIEKNQHYFKISNEKGEEDTVNRSKLFPAYFNSQSQPNRVIQDVPLNLLDQFLAIRSQCNI